ncbi:MAG: hypothetical protein HRT72_02260 [Flavobacteriales bacterium]|nr:hypothetical protein [Flavobacteriales bacterium]
MFLKATFILVILSMGSFAYAGDEVSKDDFKVDPLSLAADPIMKQHLHDDHEDDHSHHDHHPHEIGVANSPVYFISEEEFSYGLHLHYVYSFSRT